MKKNQKIFILIAMLFTVMFAFYSCKDESDEDPIYYTITFKSNSENAKGNMQSISAKEKSSVTLPLNEFIYEGYAFAGWALNSDGTKKYADGATTVLTKDVTLYAVWETVPLGYFAVFFDSDGGSAITPQISVLKGGTTIAKPANPEKTGYTFSGWFSGTKEFDFSTPVTENLTLIAHWKTNIYAVSFESNGGSIISTQSVPYNDKAAIPESPTKTDYDFAGWYIDNDFKTEFDFENPITKDTTLYAKWIESCVYIQISLEDSDSRTILPVIDYNNYSFTLIGENSKGNQINKSWDDYNKMHSETIKVSKDVWNFTLTAQEKASHKDCLQGSLATNLKTSSGVITLSFDLSELPDVTGKIHFTITYPTGKVSSISVTLKRISDDKKIEDTAVIQSDGKAIYENDSIEAGTWYCIFDFYKTDIVDSSFVNIVRVVGNATSSGDINYL